MLVVLVHVRALKPHFKSQIKPKVPDQQEKVPLPARPRVVHIVGHQKSIKSSPRLSAMSLRTLCKLNVNYQIECQNFIAGYHKHWGALSLLGNVAQFSDSWSRFFDNRRCPPVAFDINI